MPIPCRKNSIIYRKPHKEIFYCFGCHVGGDVIAFIARKEQCSQIEAAKHLIERYQIELPSTLGHRSGQEQLTISDIIIFANRLPNGAMSNF